MKKTLFLFGLMSLFILSTAMQCDDDDNIGASSCDSQLETLLNLRTDIEAMASASTCSEEFECRYIGFGSKACGGPKGFLIYTTSIDTLALSSLVENYNQLERDYNISCDQHSDCSVPQVPIGFECENNQCIPIF